MVGVPPSSSEAVAAQVRSSPTLAVLGVTVTESMVGSVFSTVAEEESVAEPPSVSVAVAVQVMVSPGVSLARTVVVSPVSPLDHASVMVGVPPSASDAVARQVRSSPTLAVAGDTVTLARTADEATCACGVGPSQFHPRSPEITSDHRRFRRPPPQRGIGPSRLATSTLVRSLPPTSPPRPHSPRDLETPTRV